MDEIETVVHDLLARDPKPKWEAMAARALPAAAWRLAAAGKSRTALLILEQAVAAGDFDPEKVRDDPAFQILRDLPGYERLSPKRQR